MIRRLLVVSAVLLISAVSSSAAQEDWDSFSADVTMRHGRILADGATAPLTAPDSTFRLERSRSNSGWKTVMVVLRTGPIAGSAGGADAEAPPAQVGMRIEDPGDGSPIRIIDASGTERRLPQGKELSRLLGGAALTPVAWPPMAEDVIAGASRPRIVGERDWIDGLMVKASERDVRVRALESRQGGPRERVRGLDRYITARPMGESEVLVDPSSALPVETNVVENGRLVTHATYEYVPYGSGSILRNRVRVEHTVPGATGERMFTVVEFTNVRTERRGVEK